MTSTALFVVQSADVKKLSSYFLKMPSVLTIQTGGDDVGYDRMLDAQVAHYIALEARRLMAPPARAPVPRIVFAQMTVHAARLLMPPRARFYQHNTVGGAHSKVPVLKKPNAADWVVYGLSAIDQALARDPAVGATFLVMLRYPESLATLTVPELSCQMNRVVAGRAFMFAGSSRPAFVMSESASGMDSADHSFFTIAVLCHKPEYDVVLVRLMPPRADMRTSPAAFEAAGTGSVSVPNVSTKLYMVRTNTVALRVDWMSPSYLRQWWPDFVHLPFPWHVEKPLPKAAVAAVGARMLTKVGLDHAALCHEAQVALARQTMVPDPQLIKDIVSAAELLHLPLSSVYAGYARDLTIGVGFGWFGLRWLFPPSPPAAETRRGVAYALAAPIWPTPFFDPSAPIAVVGVATIAYGVSSLPRAPVRGLAFMGVGAFAVRTAWLMMEKRSFMHQQAVMAMRQYARDVPIDAWRDKAADAAHLLRERVAAFMPAVSTPRTLGASMDVTAVMRRVANWSPRWLPSGVSTVVPLTYVGGFLIGHGVVVIRRRPFVGAISIGAGLAVWGYVRRVVAMPLPLIGGLDGALERLGDVARARLSALATHTAPGWLANNVARVQQWMAPAQCDVPTVNLTIVACVAVSAAALLTSALAWWFTPAEVVRRYRPRAVKCMCGKDAMYQSKVTAATFGSIGTGGPVVATEWHNEFAWHELCGEKSLSDYHVGPHITVPEDVLVMFNDPPGVPEGGECRSAGLCVEMGPFFGSKMRASTHTCAYSIARGLATRVARQTPVTDWDMANHMMKCVERWLPVTTRAHATTMAESLSGYPLAKQEAIVREWLLRKGVGATHFDLVYKSFGKSTEMYDVPQVLPVPPALTPDAALGFECEIWEPDPSNRNVKNLRIISAQALSVLPITLPLCHDAMVALMRQFGIQQTLKRYDLSTSGNGDMGGRKVQVPLSESIRGLLPIEGRREGSVPWVGIVIVSQCDLADVAQIVQALRAEGYKFEFSFDFEAYSASQKQPCQLVQFSCMTRLGLTHSEGDTLMPHVRCGKEQIFAQGRVKLRLDCSDSVGPDGSAVTFLGNCTLNTTQHVSVLLAGHVGPVLTDEDGVIGPVVPEHNRSVLLICGDDARLMSTTDVDIDRYCRLATLCGAKVTLEGQGLAAPFISLYFFACNGSLTASLAPHRVLQTYSRVFFEKLSKKLVLGRLRQLVDCLVCMVPNTPVAGPMAKRVRELLIAAGIQPAATRVPEYEWYLRAAPVGPNHVIPDDAYAWWAAYYDTTVGSLKEADRWIASWTRVDVDLELAPSGALDALTKIRDE